jgi:hypothetical protein
MKNKYVFFKGYTVESCNYEFYFGNENVKDGFQCKIFLYNLSVCSENVERSFGRLLLETHGTFEIGKYEEILLSKGCI